MLKKNLKYDRPFMANAGCLIADSKSDNIAKIDQLAASSSSELEDESSDDEPSTVSEHSSEEEKDVGDKKDKKGSPKKSVERVKSRGSGSETSNTTVDPRKRSTLGLANNSLMGTSNAANKLQK